MWCLLISLCYTHYSGQKQIPSATDVYRTNERVSKDFYLSTRKIASYWDPHSLKISNGLPYGMSRTVYNNHSIAQTQQTLILISHQTLIYNTSSCPNFASLLASSLRISKKKKRVIVILLSKYGSSHTVFTWKVMQLSHAMFNKWNITQWIP